MVAISGRDIMVTRLQLPPTPVVVDLVVLGRLTTMHLPEVMVLRVTVAHRSNSPDMVSATVLGQDKAMLASSSPRSNTVDTRVVAVVLLAQSTGGASKNSLFCVFSFISMLNCVSLT